MPAFLICAAAVFVCAAAMVPAPVCFSPATGAGAAAAAAEAGRPGDGGPWIVRADGEQIACVRTRQEAESVVFGLRLLYAKTVEAQLSSDMKEDVRIERAPEKAYRRAELSDVMGAVRSIARRMESEEPPVTVVATRTVNDERKVARPVKVIKRPDIEAGEIEIKKEGSDGKEQVVSEITLENGGVSAVKEIESVTEAEPESAVIYEGTAPDAQEMGELVIDCAVRFLGTKYVWGGNDLRNGIDCSGFTKEIYAMFGIDLPRHSSAQAKFGEEVAYEDARAGDIVCYIC